jgi:hypothetical protein
VLGVVWYAYGQSDVTAVFGVDVLMDGLLFRVLRMNCSEWGGVVCFECVAI